MAAVSPEGDVFWHPYLGLILEGSWRNIQASWYDVPSEEMPCHAQTASWLNFLWSLFHRQRDLGILENGSYLRPQVPPEPWQ